MAGIYIHIPFCKQKCSYCNFHFSTNLSLKNKISEAICKEIQLRKNEIDTFEIETIYFGGGTPSLLTEKELSLIISTLFSNFNINSEAEITIEVNPEDISKNKLQLFKYLKFNRLSIGVQSFFDKDLVLMNRNHTPQQAQHAVTHAQDMGFTNISIDLIYGSNSTSNEMWKQNLEKVKELQVPHLSCYALTVEPKTILEYQIKSKIILPINEDKQYDQFMALQNFASSNNFIQYEISNFGKEDCFSKHNISYWEGKPYLGLGPSAHSFNGKDKRSINIAHNSKYVYEIMENKLALEIEILSEKNRYNEMIMIGLRTAKGVDEQKLKSTFAEEFIVNYNKEKAKLLDADKIYIEGNFIKIKKDYFFQADGIASQLFY